MKDNRETPITISKDEFKKIGYQLMIAYFFIPIKRLFQFFSFIQTCF